MEKIRTSSFRLAFAILAALAFPMALVLAQTSGGSIQGYVLDQAGQPVIGAVVRVSGPSLQGTQGTVADTSGQYMIPYLPPGKDYTVAVEAGGYNKVIRGGITVPLGATVNLPFTLSQGSTEITVSAAGPTIDLKTAQVGATLSSQMIAALPLQRNSGQIAFLAPTAVSAGSSTPNDASLGGSTGAENNYIINGVDVTNTGYGINSSALNFEFIQDMQVIVGGLPPEYGATTGGVVNAITRSGGNEFHGSIYGYYWSDKMQAKSQTYAWAPTIVGNDGYTRYDVGGDLGGYFVKDKLWFYLAYDYNRYKEYTSIPVGPGYGDPYLYLNGAGAQSVYGGSRITDTNQVNPMYAFKLTWSISPSQKLALTVFGDRNNVSGYNANQLGTLSTSSAPFATKEAPYNVAVVWNSIWSPKFFSEATVSYRDRTQDYSVTPAGANNWAYYYYFGTGGALGGFEAYPRNQLMAPVSIAGETTDLGSNYQPSYGAGLLGGIPKDTSEQARLKFTNLVGGHEISYGLQYQHADYTPNNNLYSGPKNFVSPANGMVAVGGLTVQWAPYQFFTDANGNPLPPGPNGEQYVYQAQDYFTPGARPSTERYEVAWANDNWAITQYFTFKYGLRFEQERLEGDLTGQVINLTANYSPRLGFTWDVAHDAKSKLYGYAGRYFERVPTDIAIRGLNLEISGDELFYDPQLTEYAGVSQIFGSGEYTQGTVPNIPLTPAEARAFAQPLRAPYTDEFIIGYEYEVRPDFKIGARAVYRELGRTIEDLSYDGANTYVITNPEKWTNIPVPGVVEPGTYYFPKPVRTYRALEFTADKRYSNQWQFGGSYVLSRLEGNYEGASSNDTTVGQLDPNLNATYDIPDFLLHANGLLPLDRTHQLKAYGSYTFPNIPLELSGNFQLTSGTPISKQIQIGWYANNAAFAAQRGTAGRTPTVWALDLGGQYNLPVGKGSLGIRLDLFNVTNEQKTTGVYQTWEVQTTFGGPVLPDNALFKKPYQHQSPRLTRLALRWTF